MEDIELDGSGPVSGPAPGSETSQPAYTADSIDYESTAQPSYRHVAEEPGSHPAAPQGAPALPAGMGPQPVDELRLARDEARQANERAQLALGTIMPLLAARAGQPQQAPRPTLEQLVTDPNVTTEQLVRWVQGEVDQKLTQHSQQTELVARRGSSEQYVRGLFAGDGFQGREFDTMRSKHIQPVLERIPYLRDVITALNPEQPALVEYGLAALLEISARAKDDPVTFYRNLWQLLDNSPQADAGRRIQQAAQHAARRIAPGSATNRQPSVRGGRLGAPEIEAMSDREFDRFDLELTGGL